MEEEQLLTLPEHSRLTKIRGVTGNPLTSPKELKHLAWLASQIPYGGSIVELGSYVGQSIITMALAARQSGNNIARVFAVDYWTSGKGKTRLVNTTDPDSRMLRARNRFVQGFNAQAAVTEDQIVVAAEVSNAASDSTQFQPLVTTAYGNLADVDTDTMEVVVADAGYGGSAKRFDP